MDHDVTALVEEWLAGPNSEANGYFGYQALEHYRPAVLHWLTVGCRLDGSPDPDLYLQPTPMALQNWAIGYAGAARSRDAACGAVRSFYRWAETPAVGGGPGLVPPGTAKSLQFQRGGNFAAGLPGRELLTPDQCRWLAQAADRYPGTRREGPHRARALVYLCLNHYLWGRHSDDDVLRPGQITAMRLSGRHQEQHRTTWDVPQKNASSDATRAIDEYLPHRATALPDTGHLFTTVNGRPLEPQSLIRILRTVAATHPDLEETAPKLSADAVTHSPAT
ncbi:hypothetical protein OOK31_36510 [Streptomyces sp. NBC_00249]|uniref:hypothetical protein n=1 Tax=Streptomyces sp. NBC_00249 TaxID=2975690 RepID=UPI0022598FD1|nr:hypothetical protein [Streptomyces sp. NBC_00249]MCX5199317.1 hypothetical protein [Streptomyces sp. NBC_00249]